MSGAALAALAGAVGAWLLKATVVLLAAAGCAALARGRSAALRHAVWAAALLAVPALPLLQAALPRLAVAPAIPGGALAGPAPERVASPAASAGEPAAVALPAAGPAPSIPWAEVAAALYLAGVAALSLRLAQGCRRLRAVRAASGPPGRELAAEIAAATREAGLRRPLRAVVGGGLQAPATWGALRPVLFLPAAFAAWAPARRRRALVHELAHVRRLDALWTLAAELVAALAWPHPLVWWARRRRRAESEAACDDAVLRHERAGDYAEDLLALARELVRDATPAPASAAGAGALRRRLEALFTRAPRGPLRLADACLVVAGALALALPLAALAPSPVRSAATLPASRVAWRPGSLEAGWAPQQLRWTAAAGHGGLFVEGPVDLGALERGRGLRRGGLALVFARAADGAPRSFLAWNDGQPRMVHRSGSALVEGTPAWLSPLLAEVARDRAWIADSALATVPVAPSAGRPGAALSGSLMLGLPAWSEDPTAGVAQGGWAEGATRAGMVVRGPVTLSADGRPALGGPGAWLAAFSWDRGGDLRTLEAVAAPEGPRIAYAENGSDAPFDASAGRWLRALGEGYRSRAPDGWPGPELAP